MNDPDKLKSLKKKVSESGKSIFRNDQILKKVTMKNLSVLLSLKKEKHAHVMLGDNGVYTGMSTGSKGIVKSTDEAIAHELFGEYPLSEQNFANFKLLSKMKLAKVKKPKEQNAEGKTQQTNLDQKAKIGKAA